MKTQHEPNFACRLKVEHADKEIAMSANASYNDSQSRQSMTATEQLHIVISLLESQQAEQALDILLSE